MNNFRRITLELKDYVMGLYRPSSNPQEVFRMLYLVLIFLYIGLNALAAVMTGSRPAGTKSRPELVLFILAQGILVFLLIRLLIHLF